MSRGPSTDLTLAATALAVLLIGAAAPPATGQFAGGALADAGQVDPDTVLLDVAIQPDGDATWTISYRVRLEGENETAAFESLARDVRENRSAFESQFADRMERTVAAAENATGREMAVRNVSVRTAREEIPQQYGVLVYEFEWTNFAVAEGETLRAGDAIGGLYLDESTSITFDWPSGYGLASVDPQPDSSGSTSATWRGPRDFTTDQPRVVLSTAASTTTAADGGGGGPTGGGFGTTALVLVVILALAAALVAGFLWRRRGPDEAAPAEPSGGAEPPEDLLSNEERVLRLLEQHGGRMKQQKVVEELGWTDAKTSQVVGDLRESGEIDVFRLGRENVLDLPGADDDEGEPR